MVSLACYTDEITKVLQDECQASGKPLLFLLHGLNTDSDNFSKPADFQVFKSRTHFLFHRSYSYHHSMTRWQRDDF